MASHPASQPAAARDPGRPTAPALVIPIAILAVLALAVLIRPDLMGEASLGDFLLVSLFLGGGAAWLTGRAVARTWAPLSRLVIYCILLALAVRFCHFALFEDTMFAPVTSVVEAVFLFAIAALGHRRVRRHQMTRHYGWLYQPAGPLAWRSRRPGEGIAGQSASGREPGRTGSL